MNTDGIAYSSQSDTNVSTKKTVRVYCDMVGDLWHYGHVKFCMKAREFGDHLIVGITKDEDCIGYKRKPILSGTERALSAQGCKYVDEVLYDDVPLKITKEFIQKHHIDIVVHGDDFDIEKMKLYYGVAMEMGIFRTVPYTPGISTTEILRRIKKGGYLDALKD
jgi:cytidyltransferase-like protein